MMDMEIELKMDEKEKEMRAEEDARILKEYNCIKEDKERLDAAKKFLEKQKNDILKVLRNTTKGA